MIPETPHGAGAAFIDIGFSVFSVNGKVPFPGTKGFQEATRDYDALDAMFEGRPEAGIAIATGSPSGVFVLDIDGDAGAESLANLPALPETVEARTRRGHHLYWRMPDFDVRNSASMIAPGLDVRGTGGYVVAPPSPPAYRWTRDPFAHDIADAPEWLLDKLVRKEPETFPEPRELPEVFGTRYVVAAVEAECNELAATPEGSRNVQLNKAAYALARFVAAGKIDGATVARELAYAASRAGLDRHGIEKTIRSAFTARGAA